MINKLKLLLNTENEGLLQIILEIAEAEFKDYCNRDDIPAAAETVILNMARIQYARLDSQGLTSQDVAGVSEHFDEGFYPANIIQALNRFRKVKLL